MRLTRRNEEGKAESTAAFSDILEILAQYEDTGLSPEICANYRQFEDEAISNGVTFKRIIELMEADTDGRIKVYKKVDKCCGKCVHFSPEKGKRSGPCTKRVHRRGYLVGMPITCVYSRAACSDFSPEG